MGFASLGVDSEGLADNGNALFTCREGCPFLELQVASCGHRIGQGCSPWVQSLNLLPVPAGAKEPRVGCLEKFAYEAGEESG